MSVGSKRVKVYRYTDFLYPSCPPCSFFLENPLTRDNADIGKCREQNNSSHRQEKTLRCEVVDYYSLSTALQFPFFRRETASRRQRNIFTFSGLRPLLVVDNYGKPNGAKFKKQNWLHAQQICYQGQGRFQSSSTKSIHVQPIFSQGQDI